MTEKLRFHVTSLPHTRVTKEFCACAYTSKVLNFCKMMRSLGHYVTLYAPEGSDPGVCDELVMSATTDEQSKWFGVYDWQQKMFNIDWNASLDYWKVTNLRAAAEIRKRSQLHDMVCIVGGACQALIHDQVDRRDGNMRPEGKVNVVEPFIGYRGSFARFQVYESATHMAQNALRQGLNNPANRDDPNGDNYWDVVPVYFDPDDFPIGQGDGGYYLYMGRLIHRKGIAVAENTCRAMGAKLKIAGQGVRSWNPETKELVTEDGQTFQGDHIDYVGFADVKKRAELLCGAIAAFTPTQYFEPGGNTSVEPQACGTPVLASNFGCFNTQVFNGLTGFRPTTLKEWVYAAKAAAKLDRQQIRRFAHEHYSMDRVRHLFDAYFHRVYDLSANQGWSTVDPPLEKWPHYV